jgi:o-succinylbenzoate synthase
MQVDSFRLPLAAPLETAAGRHTEREGWVVTVETEAGRGQGEATPLPGWTESHAACETALEEAAAVADSEGLAAARRQLAPEEVPAAAHGLSAALSAASARANAEPLYEAIGARGMVESVPVNATVGDADPRATADAVAAAVDDGFAVVKVKVGARSLAADRERLETVRDGAGEVTLRVDANGAWDLATAREAVDMLAKLDVALVEQPLPADDLLEHAELRGRGVDVALDESLRRYDVGEVVRADAADTVVVKPMVHGGPRRARTVAMRARGAGFDPIVSNTVDAVLARTAAVHVAASIPQVPVSGLATADRLAGDLAPDPCGVRAGAIRVPQAPGLGVSEVER